MIIFDLDGTLWNTLLATEKAALDITNNLDINFNINSVKIGMGLSQQENLINYFPDYPSEKALPLLININKLTREYISKENVEIYDGVTETIIELSKSYKLVIITNSNDEYAKTFLKVSGLEKYFDKYIGTETYGITKQEAIQKIVKECGEQFNVYVGDIKKDMEAALGANVEFIYAKYGFGTGFEYKYCINDIREIIELIEKIKGI